MSTAPPRLSGSAVEGEALRASRGKWLREPTSYAFEWEDCNSSGARCRSIGGATGSTRLLGAGDVGHRLRVMVRAINDSGSTAARSAATAMIVARNAPPAAGSTDGSAEASPGTIVVAGAEPPVALVDMVLPVISGSAVQGQTLGASTGTWSGSLTYSYQWQECNAFGEGCLSVSGATASSYTLTASDVGQTVRVVVTASNEGSSMSVMSAVTATVVASPPPPVPTNTALPSISGSVVEGEELSASVGSWLGSPTSYAYQWQDCNVLGEGCLSVSGATASSYTLTASNLDSTVRVVVTASNEGGSTPVSSVATAPVTAVPPPPPPPVPANTVAPSVSGSAVEGEVLSASVGMWTGSPTSYAYQWDTCNSLGEGCMAVSGATASTFELTAGAVGGTVRVIVTATNAGGFGEAMSAVSATVVVAEPPAVPVNRVLPSVSGSAVEGQTLSASSGAWSGGPTSYAYQWQVCDTAGGSCSNISGATSLSYKLVASDSGGTVRVVVVAANEKGSAQVSSAATAVVMAVPLYSPSSLWNTPIAANPEISVHNAEEVKELDGGNSAKGCEYEAGMNCLGSGVEYAPTIWYASVSTPMVKVEIDYPRCDSSTVEVPLEPNWVPDPSDEGHMAVLGYNGTEYDFWQGADPNEVPKSEYSGDTGGENKFGSKEHSCPEVGKWTAGEVVTTNWKTGLAQEGGVHASNTPEGAGTITQKDLESKASYWPHALAFSYSHTCRETLSWCGTPLPANGRAGDVCEEEAICLPEGARIQLEPSFDCSVGNNEIAYKWEEQWCNTLRVYGMIEVDSSANDPRDVGSGVDIFAQQFASWQNGFVPSWRARHRVGSGLTKAECEFIYKYSVIYEPPQWCEGERAGALPKAVISHMRVLKWTP